MNKHSKNFRKKIDNVKSPYRIVGASLKSYKIIKKIKTNNLIKKKFLDLI